MLMALVDSSVVRNDVPGDPCPSERLCSARITGDPNWPNSSRYSDPIGSTVGASRHRAGEQCGDQRRSQEGTQRIQRSSPTSFTSPDCGDAPNQEREVNQISTVADYPQRLGA
jgi:hypothetical protein